MQPSWPGKSAKRVMAGQKREARLGAQKREARLGANVPAIHDFLTMRNKDVDTGGKPGHDK